jgi:3-hydroxybutyryl-CoA dehydratase
MNEYRFEDISPGLSHSFKVTVTKEMMDAFRAISGDCNPLHTDPVFAASYGYPAQVVYGMLTASFYSTLVGMHLPGKHALFQGADIVFTSPVFPGDTLIISGEVISVHEAYRQIELKAQITNQNGKKVSRAKIRAGIHE